MDREKERVRVYASMNGEKSEGAWEIKEKGNERGSSSVEE